MLLVVTLRNQGYTRQWIMWKMDRSIGHQEQHSNAQSAQKRNKNKKMRHKQRQRSPHGRPREWGGVVVVVPHFIDHSSLLD